MRRNAEKQKLITNLPLFFFKMHFNADLITFTDQGRSL